MKKLSLGEIIAYSISCLIALAGLVFLIIGLVGSFIVNGPSGFDLKVFFIPGYACFPSGAALFVLFLLIFAKKNDKAVEVAARRAARLGKTETKPKEEVKDAEFTEKPVEESTLTEEPVKEEAPQEEKVEEPVEEPAHEEVPEEKVEEVPPEDNQSEPEAPKEEK